MMMELKNYGLKCECQYPITVYYSGKEVGKYYADILVEDLVIVELKADESLHPEHEAQLLNYLKATDFEVGLLINFGRKPSFKRKVFSKKFKNIRGNHD